MAVIESYYEFVNWCTSSSPKGGEGREPPPQLLVSYIQGPFPFPYVLNLTVMAVSK